MASLGQLIIITGKTASGKDTIAKKLQEINPLWKKIITVTTRAKRAGERQNKEHIFLDQKSFEELEKNNEFLETVEYAGNYYGTLKRALDPLFEGKTLLWIIDPSRATKINELFDNFFDAKTAKEIKKNTKVVYLDLPDKKTVIKRLNKRGAGLGEIEKRIKQDEENRKEGSFEKVIINYDGQLDETVQKILEIIRF